jgi:hypothetical protein
MGTKAQLGSERPFVGIESVYGMSMGVTKKAFRDWTIRGHGKHWFSLSGHKLQRHSCREPLPSKRRNYWSWTEASYDGWQNCSQGTVTYKDTFWHWNCETVRGAKDAQNKKNKPLISHVTEGLIAVTCIITSWNWGSTMIYIPSLS